MRQQRQTMAEILEQLRSQSPVTDRDVDRWGPLPDTRTGVDLPGPDGQLFARVKDDVSPARAVTLLRAGALVAWDACGCGGYCGFDWLGAERRQALLKADGPQIGGRAKKGQWGAMSHWRSATGIDLVLAESHVRWGRELA